MKKSPIYALGLYGTVGFQFAASVIAGLFLGGWLDKKLNTSPWLALLGTLLGVVGGVFNLIKIIKFGERDEKNDHQD